MPVKEKKTSRAEFAYDTLKRRILDNLKIEAALAQIAEDKASLETVFAVAGEVGKLRARIEALEKQISG